MRVVFLFLFLIVSSLAKAQLSAENLLFQAPENYVSASKTQNENVLTEVFLPKTESLANWTERLTVQTFQNLNIKATLFKQIFEAKYNRACKKFFSLPVSEVKEFGYDTMVWIQSCEIADTSFKNEFLVVKAIQGKEALYVVQKAFRFEATQEQSAPWIEYLKPIRLCTANSPEAACQSFKRDPAINQTNTVTPIFGELFVMKVLPQFRDLGAQSSSNAYMRAMLLNTDENMAWTQRVILTANKADEKNAATTPRDKALEIATSFSLACPKTFSSEALGNWHITSGQQAFLALASCGSHTMTQSKTATSESVLILAIKSKLNDYVLQWSERGRPSETALALQPELWQQRLRSMLPIAVCEKVAGEEAPYPSCLNSLKGK